MRIGWLLAAAAWAGLAGAAGAQSYTFTLLSVPSTYVNGLNDSGSMLIDKAYPSVSCTIVQGSKHTTLRAPSPRDAAWCDGISADGTTVGYLFHPDSSTSGWIRSPTTPGLVITQVPVYGATPYGISSVKKNIGGTYYDTQHIFHGYTTIAGQTETFDAPGAVNTYVTGINDFGTAILYSTDANGVAHDYIKHGRQFTEFAYPGALITQPAAINNAGVIVGSYVDSSYSQHGMVYDSARQIYYTVDVPNAVNTAWQTINDMNTLGGACTPIASAASPQPQGGGGESFYGVTAVGSLPN